MPTSAGVEDAQDLTQEFLSRLMHKEWLNHLQDQRGKFRSFLLTFLKHFLSDQRDHAQAQKRGGGLTLVSIDAYETEERALAGPSSPLTPTGPAQHSGSSGTPPEHWRSPAMAWKKPRVTEISVAMEINCYACAEV